MKSDYSDLSDFISKSGGCTCFILTNAHKTQYVEKLSPKLYQGRELGEYHAKFNEDYTTPGADEPMLDGIRVLQVNLAQVDENSVIVFTIG